MRLKRETKHKRTNKKVWAYKMKQSKNSKLVLKGLLSGIPSSIKNVNFWMTKTDQNKNALIELVKREKQESSSARSLNASIMQNKDLNSKRKIATMPKIKLYAKERQEKHSMLTSKIVSHLVWMLLSKENNKECNPASNCKVKQGKIAELPSSRHSSRKRECAKGKKCDIDRIQIQCRWNNAKLQNIFW